MGQELLQVAYFYVHAHIVVYMCDHFYYSKYFVHFLFCAYEQNAQTIWRNDEDFK